MLIIFNILAVDDDKEILNSIDIYLTTEGFKIFKAYNGREALEILEKENIHLIILDLMMPELDGIQTTILVRKKTSVPIIMLTAKTEDSDMILGLNIGADDYIKKPFSFLELIARVKSNLRRYVNYESYKKQADILNVRGLMLNKVTNQVFVNDKEVSLTPIEFKILQLLMENTGRVFSIVDIYERVWEEDFFNSRNTVAVHIRRIREKIEVNTKEPMYLKVVWGVGYKIEK